MPNENGAIFTEEELNEIFGTEQQTPAVKEQEQDTKQTPDSTKTKVTAENVDTTKAFAHRLREEKEKAKNEVAKSLGFDSYESMIKKHEEELISSKGLNPDDVNPIVDELVKKRIDADPRMQELENFRKEQLKVFAEKELASITELTGGEITSLEQLPKDVIDLWKKTGSLKSAYLSLEGENLIKKAQSASPKSSTAHLNNLSGNPSQEVTKRPLNDVERKMWLRFNPHMTNEELDKIMVDK